MRRVTLLLCGAAISLLPSIAFALSYQFSLQLSAPLGSALLAFDFIDGGPPTNSVVLSGFASDASLGTGAVVGDVTGDLSSEVTLGDGSFFNEYLLPVSGLSTLQFTFTPTTNGPDLGSVPDTFSFFVLDDVSGLPLFDTTDPSGAASLFALETDGSASGNLLIYGLVTTTPIAEWSIAVVEQIPEPAALALTLLALAACAAVCRRRRCLGAS